ncbi:bifunctional diguanylate cyclase/phosphodiesterase [Anoxynatronum buryatiense]|uniref:Diguanylate cyclase (GGDEF) domain-containing protein n=1 Tax=Anoxynatronum buryatiense TaxID=489973 RepID=A0AA45WV31_9CLOT|nr:EAL domain-containing protein [Anoxynatronum buryatiense]SMP51742.1 diguanylate cyclase (GGDEF) domain-containing protein [Anoxynatronum buryatiense]
MKSIRIQMLAWLLLGALILFAGLGFFTEQRLRKLPPAIEAQYMEIAAARADEVGKQLKIYIDQVRMLAQSEVIQSMDRQQIDLFLPQMVLEDIERNLTVVWPDGRGITSRGLVVNVSEQEQYEKIFLEGEETWISSPFVSPYVETGKPITIVSQSVRRNGETVGLINAVVEIEFINDIVRSVNLRETGYSWIVDQHGMVVAHPDSSKPLHQAAAEIFGEEMNICEAFLTEASGLHRYHEAGAAMVALHRAIPHTPGWTFIISIPEAEMYQEVKAVSRGVLAAIGLGLALVIVFSLAYSETLSRPILEMKAVFERAAAGNLNVRANEQVANEVGQAAASFNQMLAKIRHLTYQDPLTNLNNYHGFLLDLPYKLEKLQQHQAVTGLAIVSVDDFKRINSISGYELGNEVLLTLADRIQRFLQPGECAARHFGDEFVVLLGEQHEDAFEERVVRLWEACNTLLTLKDNEYMLRTSVGTCSFQPGRELDEVMNRATMAKLFIKQKGGNGVHLFNESLEETLKEEQDIERELFHALEENQLKLVYQPVIRLDTEQITGHEALLRWQHPRYHSLSVNRLIHVAEQTGYIIEIGRWVMREACRQNRKWHEAGHEALVVAVNVSALQFEQPSFVNMVQEILQETGLPAHCLELEITERIAMMGVQEKMAKMRQLKAMGVRIAIDDFGTGYSSLAYFTQFPIDTLKIDRSFINQMMEDTHADTIVDTIITMAQGMRVSTIAEGVETAEQQERLKEKGCDQMQGYWFARPLSPEEAFSRLETESD